MVWWVQCFFCGRIYHVSFLEIHEICLAGLVFVIISTLLNWNLCKLPNKKREKCSEIDLTSNNVFRTQMPKLRLRWHWSGQRPWGCRVYELRVCPRGQYYSLGSAIWGKCPWNFQHRWSVCVSWFQGRSHGLWEVSCWGGYWIQGSDPEEGKGGHHSPVSSAASQYSLHWDLMQFLQDGPQQASDQRQEKQPHLRCLRLHHMPDRRNFP